MKTKLLLYSLPVLLFAMMLYGYRIQDHPTNIDQSSTKEFVQANHDNEPGTPTSASACVYSWAAQTSGIVFDLLTVSAVSGQIAWAGGFGGPQPNPKVIKTTDGGATWTNATGPGITGFIVYAIDAIDDQTAICSTSFDTTKIYKTVNGGALWTIVFTQAGGFIDGIKMVSATEGYAVGDPIGGTWVVLKTTDGGDTWARMATEPAQVAGEFGYNNSFLIIGNDIWFGTSNTRVYHSPDLGGTWTSAATTGSLNTYAVHFNDLLNGLAGGDAMRKSIDGGTSYTPTGAPGTSGNMNGLEGNVTDWWALRSDENIYMSTDQGGTEWTIVHTQAGALFQDIDFAIEDGCAKGWAVGNGGNIAKMTGDKPLPVELSSFTSSSINNNVTLNWTTSMESNNSGFDIERRDVRSEAQDVWSKMGFVTGNGTSSSPKNYAFTDRNINSGKYNYRLKQIDYNGNFEYYNLSNEVVIGIPEKFSLSQNYPNPFNPVTVIRYSLIENRFTTLKIYDINGKEVATLVNQIQNAGYYSVDFSAGNFSSGVYFYKLAVDGNVIDTKRMMLLK